MSINLNNLSYTQVERFYGDKEIVNKGLTPQPRETEEVFSFYVCKKGHHLYAGVKGAPDSETILQVYKENKNSKPEVKKVKQFAEYCQANQVQEHKKKQHKLEEILKKMVKDFGEWQKYANTLNRHEEHHEKKSTKK